MRRLLGYFGDFRSVRIVEMFRQGEVRVSRCRETGFAAVAVAFGAVRRDGERTTPRAAAAG